MPSELPFAERNGLKLNLDKLEIEIISIASIAKSGRPEGSLKVRFLLLLNYVTCLGVKLSPNFAKPEAFFAKVWVAISKGRQNPLTASELFEMCVLLVCLHDAENWLLIVLICWLLWIYHSNMKCMAHY